LPGEYPGDDIPKKEARAYIYQRVKALRDALNLDTNGLFITLAGDDGAEIGFLEYELRANPKKTWFVDLKKENLNTIKEKWPGANTFFGSLENFLNYLPPNDIEFINLDFQGLFTDPVGYSFAALKDRVVPGGLISYTFERARDGGNIWVRLKEKATIALQQEGLSPEQDRDTIRYYATLQNIRETFGSDFEPVLYFMYQNKRSPMSVLLIQRHHPKMANNQVWEREMARKNSTAHITQKIPRLKGKLEDRESMKNIALAYIDKYSTAEIAKMLRIETKYINAWKAVNTMKKNGYLQ